MLHSFSFPTIASSLGFTDIRSASLTTAKPLSAIEVKQVLMDSGTEFKTMIKLSENDSILFKNLSKSGKILNAYNALELAEEISKKKK